jgi:hypothetical protein
MKAELIALIEGTPIGATGHFRLGFPEQTVMAFHQV